MHRLKDLQERNKGCFDFGIVFYQGIDSMYYFVKRDKNAIIQALFILYNN